MRLPLQLRWRALWLAAVCFVCVSFFARGGIVPRAGSVRAATAGLTIHGSTTNEIGSAFPGVTVTLSGSQSATTQSDEHGLFTFNDLTPGGTYTLTPSSPFYRFEPTSQTLTNLSADEYVRFIPRTLSYLISGRVTDTQGQGLGGVTVEVGLTNSPNADVLTDANGNYSYTAVASLVYTITPYKTNYAFAPRSRTLPRLGQNQPGLDFTGEAVPVQFNLAVSSLNVNENVGGARLTVQRTGDLSVGATVEVRTVDDPAVVPCDSMQATIYGQAHARCDYAPTVETLTFNAGDATKDALVPIIDDTHVERGEYFRVSLTNASANATIARPAATVVNIQDNDTAALPNPIFNTPFFIRQHYLDFLSREPEAGEPWSNVLNNCSDVNNNPNCDRILVSQSFFGSPEFRLKGFYVFTFYRVAFGRLPTYDEIIPDMLSITGATSAEVYAKRAAFARNFVQRPEFMNLYAAGLTNSEYVAALFGRYNLTSIRTTDPQQPDTGAQVTLTQADLINQLDAGTLTRAQVLRAVVQSRVVSDSEFNRAFVAMQYYGYLRRTPEQSGYQAWLAYLNAHPSDYRTMVNGFVNSIEYRARFGRAQ